MPVVITGIDVVWTVVAGLFGMEGGADRPA
jgi:hypothetical protein